jgi:RimJ/RimL family protein N-acetyltransferase
MQILSGSGFVLRPWKDEDAQSLVRHANNEKIAMNLRDGFPHPYTLRDARSWIKMVQENRKDPVFAIDIESEACGGIGLHGGQDVYRFNAEIGYWLSEHHWGKGIVSEAVRIMVRHGFEHYPWTRIFAGVFSNNPASMKVLEKAGFHREAIFSKSVKKRGRYLDEHVYSILKDDWKKRAAASAN